MFGNGKNERPAVKRVGRGVWFVGGAKGGICVQNFIGQEIKGHAHLSLVC